MTERSHPLGRDPTMRHDDVVLKFDTIGPDEADMPENGEFAGVDAEVMDLVARLDDDGATDPLPAPEAALQPIVHLEADVTIGFEALARFGDDGGADDHFRRAATAGRSIELELACCQAALRRVGGIAAHEFVSTNVSASCLSHPDLFGLFRGVDTSRVAIELTQQSPVDDVAILDHHLAALRSIGVRIAIDDVGVGDFRVERIAQATPAMLKVSPRLVRNCDTDRDAAHRLASVVELGRRVGAITIGVGVERTEEAAVLRRLGFDAAQGYLFGRPELPVAEVIGTY